MSAGEEVEVSLKDVIAEYLRNLEPVVDCEFHVDRFNRMCRLNSVAVEDIIAEITIYLREIFPKMGPNDRRTSI